MFSIADDCTRENLEGAALGWVALAGRGVSGTGPAPLHKAGPHTLSWEVHRAQDAPREGLVQEHDAGGPTGMPGRRETVGGARRRSAGQAGGPSVRCLGPSLALRAFGRAGRTFAWWPCVSDWRVRFLVSAGSTDAHSEAAVSLLQANSSTSRSACVGPESL